eukprot:CAMPEP_0179420896 /NCGR_PEP_ID=MMETSP0799-20121207/9442_1 /TAXON_ID=46947 /ORGANISM="Geminigera cryophila, Strain CCMP2564" /LENGTH=98 /DNA_ID=CAMNT_0021194597 /DNA_START=398 /DNA_END=690 /DNA_ORIENTATION=-
MIQARVPQHDSSTFCKSSSTRLASASRHQRTLSMLTLPAPVHQTWNEESFLHTLYICLHFGMPQFFFHAFLENVFHVAVPVFECKRNAFMQYSPSNLV